MSVLVAILGLFLGSFANVLIARQDRLQSIVTGRSACPHCNHQLSWYELIPVISFFILGAACKKCRKPISIQYPLVELAVGALALICYLKFGLTVLAVGYFIVLTLLLVVAVIDLKTYMVPDIFMLPAVLIAIKMTIFRSDFLSAQFGWAVLVTGGILALLVILSGERWMGMGDIAFGVIIGLLGGLQGGIVGLVLAFLLGAGVGLIMLAFKRKNMKDMLPFGPFLAVGAFIALFCGQDIMHWYLQVIGYF